MATPITAVRPVFSKGVHYLTSGFGNRTYTYNGRTVSDFHNGADLVAKYIAADYVTAFADGEVWETLDGVQGAVPSQGNYVTLRHGDVYTVYYHLKAGSVAVRKGEKVRAGQTLGYMGSSGNSTGAHLHFGIKINGQWVDPVPYLTGEKSIPEEKGFVPGFLSGVNIQRDADSMVLYLGRSKTGTNKWGTEVPIDKNGVVLSDGVYGVGNMDIPAGAKVLSGHGLASKWILENIKEGYIVWFTDNMTQVGKGLHRSVLSNCYRAKDTLVVYDEGKNATTNEYGFEVAVDKNGIALNNAVYGKGKMAIPSGGFVISGHGKEGNWLYSHVGKGTKVTYNKGSGYIKVLE